MKSGLRAGRRSGLSVSVLFLCKGGRMHAEPERTTGFKICASTGPKSCGLLAAFGTGSQGANKGGATELSGWDPANKEWARVGQWVCMKQCGACCFLGASDPPADETMAAQLKDMTASDGWCKHFDKVSLQTSFRVDPFLPHAHLPSCLCSNQLLSLARFFRLLFFALFSRTLNLLLIDSEQESRGCTIYETRPSFCRTSPESFRDSYGIPPEQFEMVARSSCCEAIADLYGSESHELDRCVPPACLSHVQLGFLPLNSNLLLASCDSGTRKRLAGIIGHN